ncbi:hypothetical protein L218DRAFT_1009237 [Marasmius fiardii PR-910]|nr:hypothetical protein L218DRAFT_1009237 [Marasmius fiardii PR-910]
MALGTLPDLATAPSMAPTALMVYVALGKSVTESVDRVATLRFEAAEPNITNSASFRSATRSCLPVTADFPLDEETGHPEGTHS